MQVIIEILLNFVGCRTLAVQLVDETSGKLRTLATEGIDREKIPTTPTGQVQETLKGGTAVYDEVGLQSGKHDLNAPPVVVPLRLRLGTWSSCSWTSTRSR